MNVARLSGRLPVHVNRPDSRAADVEAVCNVVSPARALYVDGGARHQEPSAELRVHDDVTVDLKETQGHVDRVPTLRVSGSIYQMLTVQRSRMVRPVA